MALRAGNGATHIYRVKSCTSRKHAAEERLAGALFALTGLRTPPVRLADHCSQWVDGTQIPDKVYLASEWVESFEDLGHWLTGPHARAAIVRAFPDASENYDTLCAIALAAEHHMQQCCGGRPFWQLAGDAAARHRAAHARRFAALEALNRLLPVAYRNEQERHYLASLWIGNWDPLNCHMENFGYCADATGAPRGMTLDFGAALQMGFQGQLKEDNFEVVVSQRAQLRSLAPIEQHFARADAAFGPSLPSGPLAGPGVLPYGRQLETCVERLRAVDPDRDVATLADSGSALSISVEMAYRLQRISDSAIAAVVADCRADPAPDDTLAWRREDEVAALMIARREDCVRRLGHGWVKRWATLHAARARAIALRQDRLLEDAMRCPS
ncbi:hypothetical protein PTE30175_01979 [Pandoraea terrae]|uniref:Uncharacterized protein n=1 Tax=Pandoraea terrae TaxID=1537710 RepID=A0A5E4UHM7_9BURK|nr:hypothetical protein PTE30175_01979 [Pandoraea terrae]